MDKNSITEKLIAYFMAESKDHGITITNEMNLFESGVLDSLQIIVLFSFVESEFGISLSFDDLTEENLKSVNAIADLIGRSAAS